MASDCVEFQNFFLKEQGPEAFVLHMEVQSHSHTDGSQACHTLQISHSFNIRGLEKGLI